MEHPRLEIEVVFADHDRYEVISLQVAQGTTIEQAIMISGILALFPQIQLKGEKCNPVGIWGTLKDLHDVVQQDDRVEIYRPLVVSAQDARKQRLRKTKQ